MIPVSLHLCYYYKSRESRKFFCIQAEADSFFATVIYTKSLFESPLVLGCYPRGLCMTIPSMGHHQAPRWERVVSAGYDKQHTQ